MQFTYTGSDAGLREAAAFANELTHHDSFWVEAEALGPFKQTSLAAEEIIRRVKASSQTVSVHHYTATRRVTVAATDRRYRNKIWYSDTHIGNLVADKVNTLVHEFIHCVDYWGDGNSNTEYSHSENPHPDRPHSAPYAIGNLAELWWKWVNSQGGFDAKGPHPTASDVKPIEKFACELDLSDAEKLDGEPDKPSQSQGN